MITRFAERAAAGVGLSPPPVAGPERKKFMDQAQTDFTDYSLVANAKWEVDEGHLVLRIPLGS
jgi:hypothetical protein